MSTNVVLGARYELRAVVGRGGFGAVWRAYDRRLRREVAVKVLDSAGADLARFEREAHALARLNHPNVVTVHDFGVDGASMYLVLELLPGRSLADELDAGGAPGLPLAEVLSAADQILDGLAAAHAAGFVHRDLKPGNVMSFNRRYTIVDFGIAHALGQDRVTGTGAFLGSLRYIAPEQMLGRAVDGRADLYSLGCMLHELLTGTSPYRATTPESWLYAHQAAAPARVRDTVPTVPAGLDAFVHRLLAKSPDDRPASAAEARTLLAAVARGETVAAGGETIRAIGSSPKRRRRAALAGALVLVAAATAGVVVYWPTPGASSGVHDPSSIGSAGPTPSAGSTPAAGSTPPSPGPTASTAIPTPTPSASASTADAAPTAPTGLRASAVTATSAVLTWHASTGGGKVAKYRIYRDGKLLATVASPGYHDTTLKPSTRYVYAVRAVDQAGRVSRPSAGVAVRSRPGAAPTGSGDATPPSAPTDVYGVMDGTGTNITLGWSASTDNVGVVKYRLLRDGVPFADTTTLTVTDSTIQPGHTYRYVVIAIDAAGNQSAPSTTWTLMN